MTHVRTLKNMMKEYEEKCKIIIPEDYYFVVRLVDSSKNKEDISDVFFNAHSNCRLVLSYEGEYYILFDPLKEQPDHVSFASELCSLYTEETGQRCTANLVEFSSPLKVFVYFAWKQKEKCDDVIIKYSKGKITKNNITNYTFSEIQKILSKAGHDWDEISKSEKYGTIYKRGKSGEVVGSVRYYDFSAGKKFVSDYW